MSSPRPRFAKCLWCLDPHANEDDGNLCLTHRAEYHGLTVSELQRMESAAYAEWLDTIG